MPSAPFETWKYQRNIINRYYQSLNWLELEKINVCQKTWGDGPYGRDRIFYGQMFENRNILTTNATARLLHSIIGGVAVSSTRSQLMMKLLQRSTNPKKRQGSLDKIAAVATIIGTVIAIPWLNLNPLIPEPSNSAQSESSPAKPQVLSKQNCDPAYPNLCVRRDSPKLTCSDVEERNFKVLPPDPHGFDRDGNGIGCENKVKGRG